MPRIVSVIPPKDDSNITKAQGTKILLDNGEYLRCVHKITLVAEADSPWKAIIEVYPSNQEQINALLADVEVIKRDQEYNRLDEIEKEIQQLQDEKVLIERKHRPEVTGLSIAGVANVPMEGTFLVDKGERVLKPPKNDALTKFLKNNPMISKSIINNRLSFHELGRESDKPSIVIGLESPAVLRKQMELNLVKLIQEYQRKGLDMKYINIDLLNGVDARVTLNETPNIQEQVADATGTRTKPEEL